MTFYNTIRETPEELAKSESKVIYAKYCTDYKVKEDEYNFFDMVKSWYLTDNTMFTRNEKQRL